MSYELFVSLRHLRTKRSSKFISLNTWISIGGVALGVNHNALHHPAFAH